jgi:hypothetical protein
LERGTRRLLYDLETLGRALEDRLSAWERLQRELGSDVTRKLLPTGGGRRSAGRRRRVA